MGCSVNGRVTKNQTRKSCRRKGEGREATARGRKNSNGKYLNRKSLIEGQIRCFRIRKIRFESQKALGRRCGVQNCARAEPDKNEKTFINDSLRSEFHRKFMDE